MSEHKHFFVYSKEASTAERFVAICRGCGEVKVTSIVHVVDTTLPLPKVPDTTIPIPNYLIRPWRLNMPKAIWFKMPDVDHGRLINS